jgi:multiple antibiotic resistance protein
MTPPPEFLLYGKALVGILAIVNPLGAIPIFLSLTGDRSLAEKNHIAKTSAVSVAIILLLSMWAGEIILSFFGISISAFRAGGGLLILLMAISMLHAKQSNVRQNQNESEESIEKENVAVVPLAIPLMAGPGAISLVIVDAHNASSILDKLILSTNIVVLSLLVWLALKLASPIGDKLGTTGLNIATRIMGLLLAAIAFEMLAAGLVKLLPGLAG